MMRSLVIDSMTDIVIEPVSSRTMREVAAFIAAQSEQRWDAPAEDADKPCAWHGFLATHHGEIVGSVIGRARPGLDEEESFMYPSVFVATAHRRQGIGRRLVAALKNAPEHTTPRAWAIAYGDKDSDAERFALAAGFVFRDEQVHYALELPAPDRRTDARWRIVEYHGGNDAYDAALLPLHAQGYRGRFGLPRMTVENLKQQLAAPGMTYLLVFDGELLAGYASLAVNGTLLWVDSVVVTRSHWASGVSDVIGHELAAFGAKQGCTRAEAAADERNHASRRLMLRCGWHESKRVRRFSLQLHA